MAHSAGRVTGMQLRTQSLGGLVGGIERSRKMGDHNLLTLAPFLNGKMLDVDVTRAGGGFVLVDHGNGRHIVNMENSGTVLLVAQLEKDPAEILGGLGSMDGG